MFRRWSNEDLHWEGSGWRRFRCRYFIYLFNSCFFFAAFFFLSVQLPASPSWAILPEVATAAYESNSIEVLSISRCWARHGTRIGGLPLSGTFINHKGRRDASAIRHARDRKRTQETAQTFRLLRWRQHVDDELSGSEWGVQSAPLRRHETIANEVETADGATNPVSLPFARNQNRPKRMTHSEVDRSSTDGCRFDNPRR